MTMPDPGAHVLALIREVWPEAPAFDAIAAQQLAEAGMHRHAQSGDLARHYGCAAWLSFFMAQRAYANFEASLTLAQEAS